MTCDACGEKPKKMNKGFPKAVVEINNPESLVLLRKVVIPASMGDEAAFPPAIGKYFNVLLHYDASGNNYLYSSDGVPTKLEANIPAEILDRIETLEAQIDTKQDELTAGEGISIVGNIISAIGGGGSDFTKLSKADYNWNATAKDDVTTPFDAIALWKLDPGLYVASETATVVMNADSYRLGLYKDNHVMIGGDYSIAGGVVRGIYLQNTMGLWEAATNIRNGYPFIPAAEYLTTESLGKVKSINQSDYNWNSQTETTVDPDCFAIWRYNLSSVPVILGITQPTTKVQEYKNGPLVQMSSPTIYFRVTASGGGSGTNGFLLKINNTGVTHIAVSPGGVLASYDELNLKQLPTFDSTKTQVLKNVNGTLTWVDE